MPAGLYARAMRNRRTSPRPLVGAAVALAAAGAGEFATVEVRGTVGARAAIDTSHEGTDDVGLFESRATTLSWGERPALAMAVRGDADIETLVAAADSLVEGVV